MSTLPKLTFSDVQDYFYERFFERGLAYYNSGYIFETIRRGNILEARCTGSMPNPYRVRATLSANGIESTDCSCPIGGGCKHAAALLLVWVHCPEEFEPREAIEDILTRRSKKELVFLIREMVKREPDLEILLDLPLPGEKPRQDPVDPELYRRQARTAFYNADDWDASFAVDSELGSIVTMADRFAEAGDYRNAQIIYQVIVEEGLGNYEIVGHDEGMILGEVDRSIEGLAKCLHAFEGEPIVRQGLLRSMFEVIVWDTSMGGMGVGDAIPDILFEQANAEERQLLREWIMQEAIKTDSGQTYSREWQKEAWGWILVQLDEKDGDIEGFLERAKSLGIYRPLFSKLVELGRVEAAVDVAVTYLHSPDYGVLQSAQTLESAGYLLEAITMVEEKIDDVEDTRLLAWLAEKYEDRGELQGALHLQLRCWESRPSLEDYQTLEGIATTLDQWKNLRPRLQADLAESNNFGTLAMIHLYEEKWEAAWDAATRGAENYWSTNIQEVVARATEAHCPQRAIDYYLFRTEQLIAHRGRNNYEVVAEYLQRVRKISESIGQLDVWQQTIKAIRENNRNLPALQDELNKAGL
jgi:uncharacterized Zn finger protein